MMAILIGCVYYPGLESVLAEEKSGYRIDTAYQSETNQVVLTGNTEEVKAGVTLGVVKDQEGQEYAADSFQTTVGENGEYTYELTYSSVNAQTGAVEEKTEELKVMVDQIQAPAAKAAAQAQASSAQTQAAAAPAAETQTETEAAPTEQTQTGAEETDTMPVSQLQAAYQAMSAQERATAAANMNVMQYAEEANQTQIGTVQFSGGSLAEGEGPAWTAAVGSGLTRTFSSAGYVLADEDGSTPHLITGLYPWKNNTGTYDWYYTVDGQEGSGQDYGTIMVGHRLPEDATVRFYYKLTSARYSLTVDSSFDSKGFDYAVEGAAGGTYAVEGGAGVHQVMAGDTVTLSVKLPNTYLGALVTMTGLDGNPIYGLQRSTSDSITGYNKLADLVDGANYWYEIKFTMPEKAVSVSLSTTEWSSGRTRSFAVYLPQAESPNASQNYEFGFTRLFTTRVVDASGSRGGWTKQINYNTRLDMGYAKGGLGPYKTDSNGYWVNDKGSTSTVNNTSQTATGNSTSVSTDSSVGGGAPYTHSDWYGWTAGGSSYQDGETVKQSGDPSRSGQTVNLVDAYADPWSASTTKMAKGEYFPGGTVGFRLEMAKGNQQQTVSKYYYKPGNITLDVYEGNETISSKTFERYTISLADLRGINDSSGADKEKTLNVAGGSITIKCIAYGNTNFDPNNPTGTGNNTENNKYGGNWTKPTYYNSYGYTSNNTRASAPVYAYYIEVSGLTRPFKISYTHLSGAQQNNVIQTMEGVEEGVYTDAGIEGSTISIRNNGTTVSRPLTEGYAWNNNEKTDGYNNIAVALQEGYGELKIQYVDESGSPLDGSTASAVYQSKDNQGRYIYKLTNSSASNTISQIKITAKPLKFITEYYYENKDYTTDAGGSTTLSYDTSGGSVRSFKIPATAIPKNVQGYLQGFTVKVLGPHGTEWIGSLTNPKGGTKWDIGDEIQVEYLYQQLMSKSAISDGINNFRLQLVPQMSTGDTGDFVSASYTIYNQYTYFDGKDYVDSADYDSGLLSNFYDRTDSIRVQKNVPIMLVGFSDSYIGSETGTMTGKKYVLDSARSTTYATVTADGQHIGNVYYAAAVQLQIKVPTDLQGEAGMETYIAAINDWNAKWKDTYHSGLSMVGSFTREMPNDLPDLATKSFSGWRVVKSDYAAQEGTTDDYTSRVYDYSIVSSDGKQYATLNLNAMGRDSKANGGLAAWKDAFTGAGNGVLTLVPYYTDNTKPITLTEKEGSADGDLTGDMRNTKVYVNADGSHDHTLESTFYMEGTTVTQGASAKYAVYAQQSGSSLWGLTEKGTINLTSGEVTDRVNNVTGIYYHYFNGSNAEAQITTTEKGNTSIKLQFTSIPNNPGGTGTNYRVYMWNDANGLSSEFVPPSQKNVSGDVDQSNTALDTDFNGAARDWYDLTMIYPFTTKEIADPSTTGAYTDAYAGEHTINIQTGGTDGKAVLQATLYYKGNWKDYAGENLHLALYRTGKDVTGTSNVSDVWVDSTVSLEGTDTQQITLSAHNNMESTAALTVNKNSDGAEAGSVTISITLLNGSNNSLRYAWEDYTSPSQRVWKMYAWNLANANKDFENIEVPADGGNGQRGLPVIKDASGAEMALVDNKFHISPIAVQNTESEMHVTRSNVQIQEGQDYTVEVTYKIDPYYPVQIQLGNASAVGVTDSEDIRDGSLHTAIMKQNPPDKSNQDWQIWMNDGTVTNNGQSADGSAKVEREIEAVNADSNTGIQQNATQIKVTYTFKNVNNCIVREWEHQAKYEASAWNMSNDASLDGVTGNSLITYLQPTTGSAYNNIPSICWKTEMAWENPDYYVYIPASVQMTDSDNDGKAQAGATVRYKNAGEGNEAITLPDIKVAVDHGVTLKNQSDGNKSMTTDIYTDSDESCDQCPAADPNKVYIGMLSQTAGTWNISDESLPKNNTFTYKLTADTNDGDPLGTVYSGAVGYLFEIDTSATP